MTRARLAVVGLGLALLVVGAGGLRGAATQSGPGRVATAEERAAAEAVLKEAQAAYGQITGKVAKGEFEGVLGQLLDDGELPRPQSNAAELAKDLAREQPILKHESVVAAKAVEARVERRVIYQVPAEGKEALASDVITVTWKLQGTADFAKSTLPQGSRSPTIGADGSLVVYLKSVEGKWYWCPFGW